MRVEHLAVAEDAVHGIERHRGVEVLGPKLVGRLRPVHDAAEEDAAGLAPPALEDGIGVTKEVGRFVGRDVQHWGIHVMISSILER